MSLASNPENASMDAAVPAASFGSPKEPALSGSPRERDSGINRSLARHDTLESIASSSTTGMVQKDGAAAGTVQLRFASCKGLPENIRDFGFSGTVGKLQARCQKNLKVPVFLCLISGQDAFMPLPDWTVETLAEMFGTLDPATGKKYLIFSASGTAEAFS